MIKRDVLILLFAVLLLRLPFLNQALQGDESTFLASAIHAQIDPLHPNHTHYIFTFVERDVDLRGGSHLPMDAWALAALIAVVGEVKEVPFHAAYILFSWMAVLAAYALARRFSPRPLWAALLFLAAPAFVVNGGSFEADVPHVAFFLCGIATFLAAAERRSLAWLALSVFFLACAALTVMQGLTATPILMVFVWLYARNWIPGWIAALAPCAARFGWELFERITSGDFPFALTARYLGEQGWDTIAGRVPNATGLFIQVWFVVFPALFVLGLLAAWRRRNRDTAFLAAWIGIYFLAACALFIDGSARYMLPIAAPMAIWASFAPRRWLTGGFAVQMALSVCLAVANYQHWAAYREFAQDIAAQSAGHRLWVNTEWGLRCYMEDEGARVPRPWQYIPSGDVVVTSELVRPVAVTHPQELVTSLAEKDVRPWMPFRLIGLESHSGYSTVTRGFAPFGIGLGLVDRIHADIYKKVTPTLTDLSMEQPGTEGQILSGIYGLEEGKQRWMGGAGTVMLVSPTDAEPLHVKFYLPDYAPARQLSFEVDGRVVDLQAIGPGMQRVVTPPAKAAGPSSVVTLRVDRTFSPAGDSRQLGIVLLDVGWGK